MDAAAIIQIILAIIFLVVAGAGIMTVIVDAMEDDISGSSLGMMLCSIALVILASILILANTTAYCT